MIRTQNDPLTPPHDRARKKPKNKQKPKQQIADTDLRVKLRFEWDCKSAERKLRRASELKSNYPAVHQWFAAYRSAHQIFKKLQGHEISEDANSPNTLAFTQLASLNLTPNEDVQIYCAIAREQIDAGNYEAAYLILEPWWQFGNWPRLDHLTQPYCADILFTTGTLAGWLASTRQLPNGQKTRRTVA